MRLSSRGPLTLLLAMAVLAAVAVPALSASIGPGITKPVPLKPFKPSNKIGAKPNLPKRISYAIDFSHQFTQGIRSGLAAAAKDRGLTLVSAISNGDSQKAVQQMRQFLTQKTASMVVSPVDPPALAPVMKDTMSRGVYVQGVVFGPASVQINGPQYKIGKVLALSARDYIRTKLGGKANVVLLNQDSVQAVRPRFKAMRDVMKTIPGVKIVADIEPKPLSQQGAFQTMNTILQKNPKIDVVLGADVVVLGALASLQAAHKDSPRQFLGGVDGDTQALANIKKGGTPYKATVLLAPTVFAYSSGQFAADWLEGKTVPQGINVLPTLLTSAKDIAQYNRDSSNPASVWKSPARLRKYVEFYGNISYATRSRYLAYNWDPAAK